MEIDGFALVTGAGSGIGKACVLAYAKEGAAGVLVADVDTGAAEAVAAEARLVSTHPSFRAIALRVDVTNETSVDKVVDHAEQEFGRIDYGVNCAGVGVENDAEIAEANVAEFERFLRVNVSGMFFMTRALSAAMKRQEPRAVGNPGAKRGAVRGVILNMGSCSSFVSTPRMVQYTTSKHAVLGLTRNAALDNAPYGIRVNCLCPSWVDTPMVQRAIDGVPELQQLIEKAVPLGRIAQPEEISDTVMFLSSPRASYITGTTFVVDGGTTLTAKA